MRLNGVGRAALVVITLNALGAAIAIANRLPYEFGNGVGDPDQVASDFLSGGGTALSAPLPTLALLAVGALVAQSRRWWGTVATIGVLLLGGAFAYAASQEPILWRTLSTGARGTSDSLILAIAIVGTLASLALVLVAATNLYVRLPRS